jgi:hypothetical protein
VENVSGQRELDRPTRSFLRIAGIAGLRFFVLESFRCSGPSARDLAPREPALFVFIKKRESPVGLVNKLNPRQLSIAVRIVIAEIDRLKHSVGANDPSVLRRVDKPIAIGISPVEQLSRICLPLFACDDVVAVAIPAPCRRKEDRVDFADRRARTAGEQREKYSARANHTSTLQ